MGQWFYYSKQSPNTGGGSTSYQEDRAGKSESKFAKTSSQTFERVKIPNCKHVHIGRVCLGRTRSYEYEQGAASGLGKPCIRCTGRGG